jgi:hypothetical protein
VTAEAIETATDADAAAIVSNGRDETAAETEAIAAGGHDDDAAAVTTPSRNDEIETDEIDYDAFELRDREMLRQAGIDPDEASASSSADTSLTLDMPQTPEISREDDGVERQTLSTTREERADARPSGFQPTRQMLGRLARRREASARPLTCASWNTSTWDSS